MGDIFGRQDGKQDDSPQLVNPPAGLSSFELTQGGEQLGTIGHAQIKMNGVPVGPLVQRVQITVDAQTMVPQVRVTFIPGGLNIAINQGQVQLTEVVQTQAVEYSMSGRRISMTFLPFPVNTAELLEAVTLFAADHPQKKAPTRICVPVAMEAVLMPRLHLPMGVTRPDLILGMTVTYDAQSFSLHDDTPGQERTFVPLSGAGGTFTGAGPGPGTGSG